MNRGKSGNVTSFDTPTGASGVPSPDASPAHRRALPARDALALLRDAFVTPTPPEVAELVDEAYARAERIIGAGRRRRRRRARPERSSYASDAIVALAAEGELTTAGRARRGGRRWPRRPASSLDAARFLLFSRTVSSPRLLELPPVRRGGHPAAAAPRSRSLPQRVALAPRRRRAARVRPQPRRRTSPAEEPARRPARRCHGRTRLHLIGRSTPPLGADRALRPGRSAQSSASRPRRSATGRSAFLFEATQALGLVLERELLLDREPSRERALVSSARAQADAARVRPARRADPGRPRARRRGEAPAARSSTRTSSESHRDVAYGRFDDVTGAPGRDRSCAAGDRALTRVEEHRQPPARRDPAPRGRHVHRAHGYRGTLDLRGDPESLSSSQRIAVFRAVQEALCERPRALWSDRGRDPAPRSAQLDRRADHGQRHRVRGQPRRSRAPPSAAAWASSASASASACSAARSTSTASPAARRRSRSRCRARSTQLADRTARGNGSREPPGGRRVAGRGSLVRVTPAGDSRPATVRPMLWTCGVAVMRAGRHARCSR